ncbi:hypothetical protein ACW9H6_22160 [Pseudomonas sp. SDO528_S397]|uniref:TraD protein n=1 Tax=Pseudomonas sp. Sample_24 TaxID=2448268 RepID=UPI0010329CA9|nr:TraD protein [Pseudomonas sp. Sample_24]
MARLDLAAALKAVEPETKAAQIRQVMPIIEQQLKAGVRRQAILNVLKEQGIEIGMETLKSYLYRYRKALKAEGKSDAVDVPKQPAMEAQPQVQLEPKPESVSYDSDKDNQQQPAPMAPSELSKIMNPGDDVNASELARYESAGRSRRKST